MIYLIIFYLTGFVIVYLFDRISNPARRVNDLTTRFFFSSFSWFAIIVFILFVILPDQIGLLSKKELPKWMKKL